MTVGVTIGMSISMAVCMAVSDAVKLKTTTSKSTVDILTNV